MTETAKSSNEVDDGSEEFLEQARWLLEWHNRRGEAITSRATAVLGFVGVMLALLLQGASLRGFQLEWWTWIVLALALLCLLSAGTCALLVVLPADTQMPSVGQLRKWWSEQIADPGGGLSAAQIAESILFGLDTTRDSPISDAVSGASTRARRFKFSAIALLGALGPLTVLIIDVLRNVGG